MIHTEVLANHWFSFFICSFVATDQNSSLLCMVGTPLKAVENVRSSATGSLDDSGHGASISGIDHPAFVHPQQTSTPATQRMSPKKVVPRANVSPAFAVSLLPSGEHQRRPALSSRVDGATARSACFSQDGGFLPGSQVVVMPVQSSIRSDVVDLTVDEVNDSVTVSQFKPMVVSTQISDGPIATSSTGRHVSKVLRRISKFENSFADDDDNFDVIAEKKFKPVAVSSQISVTGNAGNHLVRLCPSNDNSKTMVNGLLESGNRNVMEAGAGPLADQVEDCTVSKLCDTYALELSQHLASRSSSPELFECDVAISDKVEAPEVKLPLAVNLPSNNQSNSYCCYKAATSDDNRTTNSSYQASTSHTTLAQKLASRKLYAKDSVNDLGTITSNLHPPKSETIPVADRASGSMKEVENSCAQTRRSSRLSNRSKMLLRDSKCRSRGVDFMDEIDEVILHIFAAFNMQFKNYSVHSLTPYCESVVKMAV